MEKTPEAINETNSFRQFDRVTIPQADENRFLVNIYSNVWYGFEMIEAMDLSQYPQGEARLIERLNVMKPRQFSYTNRGIVERFKDTKKIQEEATKVSQSHPRIHHYLEEVSRTGSISPAQKEDFDDDYLYHGGGITYRREKWNLGRPPIDKIKKMRKTGVYGSTRRVTYVSADFNRAMAHSPKGVGKEIILLEISVDELLKKRNVFVDPESLFMRDEFMRNFVVHGGIPLSAITRSFQLRSEGKVETQEDERS